MVKKIFSQILITILFGLRPLLGPGICRFPHSCTEYAAEQFRTQSLIKAAKAIMLRLLACSQISLKK